MQANSYQNTSNLALGNSINQFGSSDFQKNTTKIVHFLKEVIPSSYMFCNAASSYRTDLIIVMDQHLYKPFDDVLTLLDFAILGQKNINCTVYTYGTIYEFLSKGHLYFSSICIPENCVYQSKPGFSLPILDTQSYTDLIQRSTHLFEQNMQKAHTFFKAACSFTNESECTISAFMLQQACELTYRSLLLALRGKQIKCHDLVVLRKHLIHFAPKIIGILNENEDEEIALLTRIQEAYIKSRYDQSYCIEPNELVNAIEATHQLLKSAEEIFNFHCQKIHDQQATCKTTF